MARELIARVEQARQILLEALDGSDSSAVETASLSLAAAMEQLNAVPRREAAPFRIELEGLRRNFDTLRMRMNYLNDDIRRRRDSLAALLGEPPALYRPHRP